MTNSNTPEKYTVGGLPQRTRPRQPLIGSKLQRDIMDAFETACENRDFDVAKDLLDTFEQLTLRRLTLAQVDRRLLLKWLVDSHFRLLELRA